MVDRLGEMRKGRIERIEKGSRDTIEICLSILFLKTPRNELARPVMGTIFLVSLSL